MEEYAVLQVSNGTHTVAGEHIASPNSAKVLFHSTCSALWNAQDVILGAVMIVDSSNRIVNGYHEIISHPVPTQAPAPAQSE